jgi:Ala-tRNA(Pro) deacylase
MAIARRLKWYLDAQGVEYEVLPHPRTETSEATAREARVPPERLAKPVLLEDENGYLMVLVPASRRVELDELRAQLHRDLELASEQELAALFHDCARGAMPALGSPYQVPTVYDETLDGLDEVYFEAGDHEDVIHMKGSAFLQLLTDSLHGHFSRQA